MQLSGGENSALRSLRRQLQRTWPRRQSHGLRSSPHTPHTAVIVISASCLAPLPPCRPQASALAQNLFISPPTVSQHAAAAAFGAEEELEGHVARYRRNRAVLLEQLPRAGFGRVAAPDGAFYVYADVSHLVGEGGSSMALARRILDTTGVAVTPGLDFDRQASGGAAISPLLCREECVVALRACAYPGHEVFLCVLAHRAWVYAGG